MKKETLDEVSNEYAKTRYSTEEGFREEDYYISFLILNSLFNQTIYVYLLSA